jgi:hypothetical protein
MDHEEKANIGHLLGRNQRFLHNSEYHTTMHDKTE